MMSSHSFSSMSGFSACNVMSGNSRPSKAIISSYSSDRQKDRSGAFNASALRFWSMKFSKIVLLSVLRQGMTGTGRREGVAWCRHGIAAVTAKPAGCR